MTTPQSEPSSVPAIEYSASASARAASDIPIPEDAQSNKTVAKSHSIRIPKGFWGWQLLWLVVLLGFSTMGTGALLWLLTAPPPARCEEISPLSVDGDRLYCADVAAKSGEVEAVKGAFALVESWPENHPLQSQAQQMMQQWSRVLIARANEIIDQGDLQGAIELVNLVPKETRAYERVEKAIAGWKNDWDKGQQIYDKAIAALKTQDWKTTFNYIQALTKLNNPLWSEKRFNELVDRMSVEKQGNQRLEEARDIAKKNQPRDLAEAIDVANRINNKLYVSQVAKKEIQNWSRVLLDKASESLEQKNLKGVINTAGRVPKYSPLYQEAQDVILLSRVHHVVGTQASDKPLLEQMFVLLEGQSALDKIQSQRPEYQEAQVQVDQLSGQVQDLMSLQMATALSKIGHPLTYQWAIEQAQTIDPQRPRRVHAQTLVAHWRKEVQRIEDRPYIVLARQLAKSEDLDGFRAALNHATQVKLGSPLRIEAQTLIAEWTKRVQIIEDQPLLTEAIALAEAGKLSAAIDKASEIGAGRALYGQAQDKVGDWVATIQIAEDRPILNRAARLARQGNYGGAIAEASRIGYGRALYYEARGSISTWAAKRDAIWAAQQREQEAYSSSYSQDNYSSGSSGYSDYSSGSSGYSSGYSGYYEPEPSYAPPAPTYYEPEPSYAPPAPSYTPPAPAPAAPQYSAPPPTDFFLE
jgi:hypothetical protein